MTAPNQSYPDLIAALGVGAYQLGGEGMGYGQDVDEAFAKSIAVPTLTSYDSMNEMVHQMTGFLRKMPLDTLKMILQFLPGVDPDTITNTLDAVDAISDALTPKPGLDMFQGVVDFFQAAFNAIVGYTDFPTLLTDLDTAWDNLMIAVGVYGEANYQSFRSILQALLGVNPDTRAVMDDIVSVVDNIHAGDQAFKTLLTDINDDITVYAQNPFSQGAWDTLMSALNADWNQYASVVTGLQSQEWDTIQKIVSSLLHISPTTGKMDASWLEGVGNMLGMDDAKVQNIGQDLQTLSSDQEAKQQAWNTLLQAGWDTFTNNSMTFQQKINALQSAWNTFAAEVGDIQATDTLTIQSILNELFPGLFPDGNNPTGLTSVQNFFDDIRRSINQMIEGLHLGYLDVNWVWHASLTTPTAEMPGSAAAMTPGRNDDDAPAISSQADSSIPAAPTGLIAVPWLDLSVPNFPAGTITYAISAVKGGVEGPATQVKAFAGTLIPPNTNGRVDLAWNAVSGATYKIYRKVDSTYTTALDWRLIASPSTAGTLLSPYQDKTVRTGGTAAHPKTDAELAAQIVTAVKTTATGAATTAGSAQATATSAASTASAAQATADDASTTASSASSAAEDASSLAAQANTRLEAIPEGNIVINAADPETEAWGVTLLATGGPTTWKAPNNGGLLAGSVSWTQSFPAGSKMLFIFAAFAGRGTADRISVTFDDPSISAPGRASSNLSNSAFNDSTNTGSGSLAVWTVALPRDFSGTSVTITAAWDGSASNGSGGGVVDMSSLVAGGTTSGDFEIVTSPTGTIAAPDDSLLVQLSGRFLQSTSVASPTLFSGYTAARTTQDQVSVQPKNQPAGAGQTMTYGTATLLATRNIDDTAGITYPALATDVSQMLLVVKSAVNPGTTVGSFAQLVNTATTTITSSSGVYPGYRPVPNLFFSAIVRSSSDISVDLTAGTFTVSLTGTYLIQYRYPNLQSRPLINGSPIDYVVSDADVINKIKSNYGGLTYGSGMTFVYLKAGDVIQLGFASSSSGSNSVPRSGVEYLKVTLTNRSLM